MAHTPGPWKLSSDSSHSVNGRSGHYEIYSDANIFWLAVVRSDDGEEQKANAHLIAAAPELLEALKMARSQLQFMAQPEDIEKRIDAAIAKAEGK